jgi:hypothetical protein
VQDIFYRAHNKLLEDLSCSTVESRMHNIHVQIVTSQAMVTNLKADNYERFAHIPAYYDPNIHTIFLNKTHLSSLPSKTIFIVCYHELIHGASLHVSYKLPGVNVFQSGIKFERYRTNQYKCYNRLLNEGMVQYLTTYYNKLDSEQFAYPKEVGVVKQIAQDLGVEVVKNALLYEQYTHLKTRFDAFYGQDTFAQLTDSMDKRAFRKVKLILQQRSTNYHFIAFNKPTSPLQTVIGS